ncbi:MAG: RND transporter [Proteobacteria bacterium]|nr:MAG: RND transporter [Pseudomonadota bacterium]
MTLRPQHCAVFLLSIMLLYACNPFAPVKTPDASEILPKTYGLYEAEPADASPWWHHLASPELNRLIRDALADNFSIKSAWARLRQARAMAVQAGAAVYPDLETTTSANFSRSRSGEGASTGAETYGFGLVSSYEVDLWGRVQSVRQAALLDIDASRADMQAAMVSLAAEVADRWVRIIARKRQKRLLEKQLANNRTLFELIELRFRKAMISVLDVYQQQQVVANVRARIPLVEGEIRLLMHELAVLLGKPPQSALKLTQTKLPDIAGIPSVGLPADLLDNRPDIRAAGRRLKSVAWQVAAARANRLPAIRLTAGAQYGAADMNALFDTWLLSLAANLAAPLFDAGRRAAEVDRQQALADENLWAYRQTVLTAVKEVSDALSGEALQREHIHALEAAFAAARKGLDEAMARYRAGLSDYLPVLTQLLSVQELEYNLIGRRAQLILYRIGLYRALGGQWPTEIEWGYEKE